ncbi:2-phospho-L-lactate transferase [Novosphingobium sp. CCH12-A3]|uniref:2-phospho-L-lactate transferase n=1 Tax=Novosphingobium sp. CCH12-A3 TaxID=1768752 RepID=UPI00078281C6|nr:2-phospho-L-lactate transferase [Novosphingobium sp. CCH12-A3]
MKVTVLTGGVGGAKLVLGLLRILPAADVTAIVNTGDDFRHLGLHVSPDIDTLLYTLSGKANRRQGWGREDETWSFLETLRDLGGPDWFQLGDRDVALHVLRTARLAAGDGLDRITADMADRFGIGATILPMANTRVATQLETDEGLLEFQDYFVARRCVPRVSRILFDGADDALPAPGVLEAIAGADAVVTAPSNPFLSIDPLLAIPGIRSALVATQAPVVAVSPIIGGKAVKGPTAKLMEELGTPLANASIAAHYADFIDGLVIDQGDDAPDGVAVARTATLMHNDVDKVRVAQAALDLAASIADR